MYFAGGDKVLEAKVKDLQEINNLLLSLVSEAKFEFRREGLSVSAVDPSHVAMLTIEAHRDGFINYEVEKNIELGIEIDKLKEILKLVKKNETVRMLYKNNKLHILFNNLKFAVNTMDVSYMKIPKVNANFENYVIIETEKFLKALRAAANISKISNSVTLSLTPEYFEITALGEAGEETQAFFNIDKVEEINCDKEIKAQYNNTLLYDFVSNIESDVITIFIDNNFPLKIDFEIMSGFGKCNYLLAPILE